MDTILYQFLLFNKQLSLPGIGTIRLQKRSSEYIFAEKCFTAPTYNFKLKAVQQSPSRKLFEWISKALLISDWEAIKLVNDFSFDLKNQISVSGEMNWKNVGRFLRDEKGNIVLDPVFPEMESEMPVIAEKVIRKKVEHKMLVGDTEKTIYEMEELMIETPVKKDYGWIIAIVAIVLSVMIVGIYLSEKGLIPYSAGNQNTIQIK